MFDQLQARGETAESWSMGNRIRRVIGTRRGRWHPNFVDGKTRLAGDFVSSLPDVSEVRESKENIPRREYYGFKFDAQIAACLEDDGDDDGVGSHLATIMMRYRDTSFLIGMCEATRLCFFADVMLDRILGMCAHRFNAIELESTSDSPRVVPMPAVLGRDPTTTGAFDRDQRLPPMAGFVIPGSREFVPMREIRRFVKVKEFFDSEEVTSFPSPLEHYLRFRGLRPAIEVPGLYADVSPQRWVVCKDLWVPDERLWRLAPEGGTPMLVAGYVVEMDDRKGPVLHRFQPILDDAVKQPPTAAALNLFIRGRLREESAVRFTSFVGADAIIAELATVPALVPFSLKADQWMARQPA